MCFVYNTNTCSFILFIFEKVYYYLRKYTIVYSWASICTCRRKLIYLNMFNHYLWIIVYSKKPINYTCTLESYMLQWKLEFYLSKNCTNPHLKKLDTFLLGVMQTCGVNPSIPSLLIKRGSCCTKIFTLARAYTLLLLL